MNEHTSDPTVRLLRDEISALDLAIVDAVNARLELVKRLKLHKESQGMPFLDPDRERQLLEDLARQNRGPLSPEGLRELYAQLLDLTKREVMGNSGSRE
jgi:3-deoxy-7-phosphoheptulonate synthase/chorismate mutase